MESFGKEKSKDLDFYEIISGGLHEQRAVAT
jgi:hypothetical protein